ncbi:MAG: thioredoxin-dependent thiol peroxidase [Myxococcota bacterium]
MLEPGDRAPDFELPIEGGGTLSSRDLEHKPYVVYFYPKDNTPGCTTEACDFRDSWERITGHGATVVGVSKDSVRSHDNFKAKHDLPFHLVSDKDLELHEAYGAWGTKKNFGREYEGTIRSTFLVDADGRIARVWPKVKVKGHVDEVVEAIEGL